MWPKLLDFKLLHSYIAYATCLNIYCVYTLYIMYYCIKPTYGKRFTSALGVTSNLSHMFNYCGISIRLISSRVNMLRLLLLLNNLVSFKEYKYVVYSTYIWNNYVHHRLIQNKTFRNMLIPETTHGLNDNVCKCLYSFVTKAQTYTALTHALTYTFT